MGSGKLALGAIIASVVLGLVQPGTASGAGPGHVAFVRNSDLQRDGPVLVTFGHLHLTTSYYCYARVYWWFYRPYVEAAEGYQRCMPYFHYAPPGQGRPPRGNPELK
jgi:hypothetical protein